MNAPKPDRAKQAEAALELIIPADYPELQLLAWNRDPSKPITGADAFGIYEAQWRHVDTARLQPHEQKLIQALTEKYGNGHFLGR